jgi:hypothetical protein
MITERRNTVFHYDAILIYVLLFLGVLFYSDSVEGKDYSHNHSGTVIISTNDYSAVLTGCLKLQVFQKTWILNKDNFDLLAFNRNPRVENSLTGIQVAYFQKIRRSLVKVPQFILRYHLFPDESDAFPVLC